MARQMNVKANVENNAVINSANTLQNAYARFMQFDAAHRDEFGTSRQERCLDKMDDFVMNHQMDEFGDRRLYPRIYSDGFRSAIRIDWNEINLHVVCLTNPAEPVDMKYVLNVVFHFYNDDFWKWDVEKDKVHSASFFSVSYIDLLKFINSIGVNDNKLPKYESVIRNIENEEYMTELQNLINKVMDNIRSDFYVYVSQHPIFVDLEPDGFVHPIYGGEPIYFSQNTLFNMLLAIKK